MPTGFTYDARNVFLSVRFRWARCQCCPSTDHFSLAFATLASTGPRLSKVTGNDTCPALPTLCRFVGGTYAARRIGTTALPESTENFHRSRTWLESVQPFAALPVAASSTILSPGVTPSTTGTMAPLPWSTRVFPCPSNQRPAELKPRCMVPADDIIARLPCRTPSWTHSEQKTPVPLDSDPRSATGVIGPRKNGMCPCPAWR